MLLDSLDHKVCKAFKGQLVLKVFKERLVLRVYRVLSEHKGQLDLLARKVYRVYRV